MGNDNNWFDYKPGGRVRMPQRDGQVIGPYDEDSQLFQDLVQRNVKVVAVYNLDLRTAGSLLIEQAGYHFVLYGNDGSANKAVNSTAYVAAYINKRTNDGSNPFPAKHARGFSGPFGCMFIEWPAQSNVYADLVIYKNWEQPWVDGEAPT